MTPLGSLALPLSSVQKGHILFCVVSLRTNKKPTKLFKLFAYLKKKNLDAWLLLGEKEVDAIVPWTPHLWVGEAPASTGHTHAFCHSPHSAL